jgi:hypothetical protein
VGFVVLWGDLKSTSGSKERIKRRTDVLMTALLKTGEDRRDGRKSSLITHPTCLANYKVEKKDRR